MTPRDVGVQTLENKVLSWGIIGKSAPILAEITIRKSQILAQIIDLLKRQGRVSYSALKRRFDLDDDYLNDLKDELLFAHPVIDEDNRGLVWTGNVEGTTETSAPPPQAIPSPLPQETASVQHVAPVGTTRALEAERRQLTVMFCDLVDSTKLSS